MAGRFQFTLRNLFWATTLMAIACLAIQFAFVGVPYWWKWGQQQAIEAKEEELRRLRALESELPPGEERRQVYLRRRELEDQLAWP